MSRSILLDAPQARRWILAAALCLLTAGSIAWAQGGTPAPQASTYAAVAAICADCHAEWVTAFAGRRAGHQDMVHRVRNADVPATDGPRAV